MPELIDRSEGRRLFGADPRGYEEARPQYPRWVFDKLASDGLLGPGGPTLEIGPATGLATRALLAGGASPVTLVEPDERFAPALKALLARRDVSGELVCAGFEDVDIEPASLRLIVAATSFHWLDAVPALSKCRLALQRDGAVALLWNVLQVLGAPDAFHDATQSVLAPMAVSPSGPPDAKPYALDQSARRADAAAAGFASVGYEQTTWSETYSPARIGKLYAGFSQIQRLPAAEQERILEQLMDIAERDFGGVVERNVTTCLYILRASG